jgi:hypothetical protein
MKHLVVAVEERSGGDQQVAGGLFLVHPEPAAFEQDAEAGSEAVQGLPQALHFFAEKPKLFVIVIMDRHRQASGRNQQPTSNN